MVAFLPADDDIVLSSFRKQQQQYQQLMQGLQVRLRRRLQREHGLGWSPPPATLLIS